MLVVSTRPDLMYEKLWNLPEMDAAINLLFVKHDGTVAAQYLRKYGAFRFKTVSKLMLKRKIEGKCSFVPGMARSFNKLFPTQTEHKKRYFCKSVFYNSFLQRFFTTVFPRLFLKIV